MEIILLLVQRDQKKNISCSHLIHIFFAISIYLFVYLHIIKMCHGRFDVNCDQYGTMLLSKMKTN